MAGCSSCVQISNINSGVQSLVGEGVRGWPSYAGAVNSVVSIGPFCAGVRYVLLYDQTTISACDFAASGVEIPVNCSTILARTCVAVENPTGWTFTAESSARCSALVVIGALGLVLLIQLINSLFSSGRRWYLNPRFYCKHLV